MKLNICNPKVPSTFQVTVFVVGFQNVCAQKMQLLQQVNQVTVHIHVNIIIFAQHFV